MTIEKLLGSIITSKHTLQIDRKEVEVNKKMKEDLTLRIVMQEEDEDLDEEMVLLTRNIKRFVKKKGRVTSPRRQEDEKKGKEIKRDLKIKEKKNTKDKIQCYKYKGYIHVMHEHQPRIRIKILRGRWFSKLPWN